MKRIIPAIAAIGIAATGMAWAQTAPPGTASGGNTGTVPGTGMNVPNPPGITPPPAPGLHVPNMTSPTTPGPVGGGPPAPGLSVPPPMTAPNPNSMPGGTPRADAPPSTSAAPAAVTTTAAPSRTTEAPVPGANSFTEGQARSRIEERGFAQISDLRKDDQGIWRGKAMKDGRSVSVALDYQGNIVAQ